jgi:hypothetical protein
MAAAIAVAVTVCVEACVVHALSIFQGVGRPGLLVGNGAAVVLLGGFAWARRRMVPWRFRFPRVAPAGLPFLALAPLVLFSALAYPPNNWDSMTYHLARVGYWLQNRSVGGYATAIDRQVVLPPGAEYLLLLLQGVAGSDRLAALVQFGSWVVVAAAAPPLARTFGVARRLAPWTALVSAGGAMAVLQASSTQNDLVAAVLTVGLVGSCVPFLHRTRRGWGTGDVALVALGVVGGLVAKPVSIVCAAPFLARAAWSVAGQLRAPGARIALLRAAPVLLVAAAVLLPAAAAARHAVHPEAAVSPFLYSGVSDPLDRPLNSVRGVLRDAPLPLAVLERPLAPPHTPGCPRQDALCLELNAAPIEDLAASPGPMLLVLLGIAAAAAGWSRLPARARLGAVAWSGAWVLFHALLRDNVWIPRLHLPLFALAPVALGALGRPAAPLLRRAIGLLLAATAAHAAVAGALNLKRPLGGPVERLADEVVAVGRARELPGEIRGAPPQTGYYRLGPAGLGAVHDSVLRELERSGCRRLAVFLGADSWDYPLSWRAMQRGVEIRHLVGDEDDWACAVFSDRGEPPALAANRGHWARVAGVPSLFLAVDTAAAVPAAGR